MNYSTAVSTYAASSSPVYLSSNSGNTIGAAHNNGALYAYLNTQPAVQPVPAAVIPPKARGKSMISELFGDLRGYIKENRDLIFSIVFVLVLDEYVFAGAFRERLKGVIEGVLKKVERKTGIDIPGV